MELIYGYMATQIAREETHCRHMGYSFRLAARVVLYASSHRQDNTYHSLCYTICVALAGTRNSSMGPPWRIDPMTHPTMSLTRSNLSWMNVRWRSMLNIMNRNTRIEWNSSLNIFIGRYVCWLTAVIFSFKCCTGLHWIWYCWFK